MIQGIIGIFICLGIFIFPQVYNTFFSSDEKLWRTFFIPGIYYSKNLDREARKKYLFYYLIFWIAITIISLVQ